VLARKWRPQAFADMTGQEHVVRTLANAIAQDRVAHAYLFCGPRGVGKTTAARLLAKALNCEKGPTATPCGECAPCREIAAGNDLDVAEIDGASNNGVENVREIREAARFLPQRDRNKIYIVDEVHMLSTPAFNALLKTLEEPPPHVKFIFATTEPHKLPDTILSRCQRHNFRRIPTAMMISRLREILTAEKSQLTDRSLALVVRQSDGGMRDALSLLDQILSACGPTPTDEAVAEALGTVDRTHVHRLAKALLERTPKDALASVEEVFIRGVDLRRLAEELALYLRHILVTKVTREAPEELAESEKKAVLELANPADAAQIARLFDLVHESVKQIREATQPKLAFEVALLKAIHLAPGAAVEDLVGKLEALSTRIQNGGTSAARPGPTFQVASAPAPAPAVAPPVQPSAPKVLVVDSSPEGCATGECLPDIRAALASNGTGVAAVPAPAPVAAPVADDDEREEPESFDAPVSLSSSLDNLSLSLIDRWKAVLESAKKLNPLLADSLSHARPLWIRAGEVAVVFAGAQGGYHKMRVERPVSKPDLDKALATHFGRATSLKIEKDAPLEDSAPLSPAEEKAERRTTREQRLTKVAREHPSVRAALSLLGGTLQEVRVRDEIAPPPEEPEGFDEA